MRRSLRGNRGFQTDGHTLLAEIQRRCEGLHEKHDPGRELTGLVTELKALSEVAQVRAVQCVLNHIWRLPPRYRLRALKMAVGFAADHGADSQSLIWESAARQIGHLASPDRWAAFAIVSDALAALSARAQVPARAALLRQLAHFQGAEEQLAAVIRLLQSGPKTLPADFCTEFPGCIPQLLLAVRYAATAAFIAHIRTVPTVVRAAAVQSVSRHIHCIVDPRERLQICDGLDDVVANSQIPSDPQQRLAQVHRDFRRAEALRDLHMAT